MQLRFMLICYTAKVRENPTFRNLVEDREPIEYLRWLVKGETRE